MMQQRSLHHVFTLAAQCDIVSHWITVIGVDLFQRSIWLNMSTFAIEAHVNNLSELASVSRWAQPLGDLGIGATPTGAPPAGLSSYRLRGESSTMTSSSDGTLKLHSTGGSILRQVTGALLAYEAAVHYD